MVTNNWILKSAGFQVPRSARTREASVRVRVRAEKTPHTVQYTCLASRPATFDILTPHDMDSSTADSRLITVLNNKLIKNDNRVILMIKVTNDKLAR